MISGVPGGEIMSTVEDFAGDVLWVGGGVCIVDVCTAGGGVFAGLG